MLIEPVKTRIGNLYSRSNDGRVSLLSLEVKKTELLARVNGTEGVILRSNTRVGECVEKGRLADIGQTNNTDFQVVARSA